MATHTTAADAKYHSSGQAVTHFKNIHDGLLAVGLTKTADTGQLDLTSAPTITMNTANHDYGYSIFEFTDAFQSTYPIYLKVRYMNDAGARNDWQRITVRIEVGEGTDGSGALTGKTDTRFFTESGVLFSNQGTLSTNNIAFIDGTLIINTAIVASSGTIPGYTQRLVAVGRRKDLSGFYTKGIYKVQFLGSSTNPIAGSRVEESHITEYKTTVGVLVHPTDDKQRGSILKPYHWNNETTSISYDNSVPVLPLYVLTPVPEYIPGVIATDAGLGFNASLTTDFDGTKTFLTSQGLPNNDSNLRLGYIWE